MAWVLSAQKDRAGDIDCLRHGDQSSIGGNYRFQPRQFHVYLGDKDNRETATMIATIKNNSKKTKTLGDKETEDMELARTTTGKRRGRPHWKRE